MLEVGLFDAINHFKVRARTVLLLLRALKFNPGKYPEPRLGCRRLDLDRFRAAENNDSAERKKKRKARKKELKKT